MLRPPQELLDLKKRSGRTVKMLNNMKKRLDLRTMCMHTHTSTMSMLW